MGRIKGYIIKVSVDSSIDGLFYQQLMVAIYVFRKFEDTLQALQWPVPLKTPYSLQIREQVKAFERAFSDLLILQQP